MAYIELALAPPDAKVLVGCAERFEQIGALRYAVECIAEAAEAFIAAGDQNGARQVVTAVCRLRDRLGEGNPPEIKGLDLASVELTTRELQIVELARPGDGQPRRQ